MNHAGSELTIDIGGEGRHPQAWNINPSLNITLGETTGQPIPNLIVARADALPFRSQSVQNIIVERTPMSHSALHELSRVIRSEGQIVLRHVPLPHTDRHQAAMDILQGNPTRRETTLSGQTVIETVIDFS